MIRSGKRHLAMALGLVLVLSACSGGAGGRDGSSGFLGRIFGGGSDSTAQAEQAANPASGQAATESATGAAARTGAEATGEAAENQRPDVRDLGNQTAAGDLTKYETEAVAGSGSFRKLFSSIFGGGDDSAPQGGAVQTATAEPLVAADGSVYYPQQVQPRSGGLRGYFTGLFRPDDAPAAGGLGGATFGRNVEPEVTLRVNRYIWTAALDVLAFMPLETVDPFSGVFTTGYGTPPGGRRAYRATVYVQDPALDARALNVALESRDGGPVNLETTRAIEDAILTRARQLWIAENES